MLTEKILASLSSERLHPAAGRNNTETHRQISIRAQRVLWKNKTELSKPEASRIPEEDLQITRAHGDSQRLTHQPKSIQGLDLDLLNTCSRCATWSLFGSPRNWSRSGLWLCCLLLEPLSWLACVARLQWRRMQLVLPHLGVLCRVVPKGGFPRGGGDEGRDLWKWD